MTDEDLIQDPLPPRITREPLARKIMAERLLKGYARAFTNKQPYDLRGQFDLLEKMNIQLATVANEVSETRALELAATFFLPNAQQLLVRSAREDASIEEAEQAILDKADTLRGNFDHVFRETTHLFGNDRALQTFDEDNFLTITAKIFGAVRRNISPDAALHSLNVREEAFSLH